MTRKENANYVSPWEKLTAEFNLINDIDDEQKLTKKSIPKDTREGFSKRLTQALNARDFPVKKRNYELRTRYNCTQQAVNKWSHGVIPRIETLCAICDDLNINLTWLVTGKGNMNDVIKIDVDKFEEVVIKIEEAISKKKMEGLTHKVKAKLYAKYFNLVSTDGELNSDRLNDDLELLQAML